jgi:hypothetical protein
MSQPSILWWQKYGTLAQMAQATVALLGFVAILFQINEIRSNARAVSARQAFLGYTDLAFKNPKFSLPEYDAIKAGSRDEQVQYENFVSYFLYACEEATAAFADRRVARLMRLRSETASAVPVRKEQGGAAISADLQHRYPAMDRQLPEDCQRYSSGLQAGKDLRQR